MPQIKQYTAQVEPVGGINGPRATGEEMGAGFGDALSTAGEAIEKSALVLHEYKNRVDVFEAEKIAASQQGETINWLEEQKKSAPLGAKGFAENVTKNMQNRADLIMQSDEVKAMSPEARAILETKMLHNNNRRLLEAHNFEAQSTAEAGIDTINKATQTSQNMVYADPTKLSEAIDTTGALIASAPWGNNQVKSKIVKNAQTDLYNSAMQGTVDHMLQNPSVTSNQVGQLIKNLSTDESIFKNNANSAVYRQEMEKLGRFKDSLGEKEQKLLVDEVKTAYLQNEKEGSYPGKEDGLYDEAWLNKHIQDPTTRKELLAQAENSFAVSNFTSDVLQKPFSQTQSELLEEGAALKNASTDEYKGQAKAFKAKLQAFQGAEQFYKKDPVGYTWQAYPEARLQYQKMQSEPSAANSQNYIESMLSAQKNINPFSTPTIVPKDEVGQFTAQMNEVLTTPNGADAAYKLLSQKAQSYGKYWPIAAKDFAKGKAMNDETYIAATLMGDPSKMAVAENLIKASKINDKEFEKTTGDNVKKIARDGAKDALTDLNRTLSAQVDGISTMAKFQGAIEKYSLYQASINGGTLTEDQVHSFANQIVNDKYNFYGSYRVPTAQNGPAVERGASIARGDLDKLNIIPAPSMTFREGDAQEIDKGLLKSTGRFVTNSDESGLRFVDQTGKQVWIKDGDTKKPLQYKWGELRAMELSGAGGAEDFTPAANRVPSDFETGTRRGQ